MSIPLYLLPRNFNPERPIPNNPFFSSPAYSVCGTFGSLIVGSGLSVNYCTGNLITSGGGVVVGITGTAPIVIGGTATTPDISIGAASNTALGVARFATVAEVAAKTSDTVAITPLTLGQIYMPCSGGAFTGPVIFCNAATFCCAPIYAPGVCIGDATNISYNNTTSGLTATDVQTAIDEIALGLVTPATTVTLGTVCIGGNISVTPAGEISVASASTALPGVVQLYDGTNSTATNLALTANQGKILQDQIDVLSISSNIILAGTYDASTGFVATVTTLGTSQGFVVGAVPPAPAAGNTDYFLIVEVQGSIAPATATATPPFHIGDWFLSDGTVWTFLNVGYQPGAASTTAEGIVYLATNAEVQAGLDISNKAVNPASLQSKISDSVTTTSSTTIASSTAVKAAYDLANLAIPKACVTAKGAIISGTAASTPTALAVGTDGQVLAADSASPTGLIWTTIAAGGSATRGCEGVVYGCMNNTFPGNTYLGYQSPFTMPTGQGNTAVGNGAMLDLTTGCCNTAVGLAANLVGNPARNFTVAIGARACVNGDGSTAIGTSAEAGQGSTMVGYETGGAIGNATGVGYCALGGGGGNNGVAVGYCALVCSGSFNVAVGACAGAGSTSLALSGNTFIGYCAGFTSTSGTNNIAIGCNAQPSTPLVGNQITLGNNLNNVIRAAVTTITSLSDARDKTDIVALPIGLDFVNTLNPVKFTWQQREPNKVRDGTSEAGFIAQELRAAEDAAGVTDYLGLVYDVNPEKLEASAGKLIPVLVKAIQELSAKVDYLESRLP